MIKTIKKDTNTYPIVFFMADSSDHVTGKTGLTPTVTISKNGGAFGAAAGAVSEIANGFYKVAGNATDSNTVGPLVVHATATGADPSDVLLSVVSYNPYEVAEPGDEMAITSTASANLVDAVWDEELTGATHNVATSAGRRLRTMDSNVILTEVLPDQTGVASNAIKFDGGASTVNGAYDPAMVVILDGDAAGQCRLIYQYVGATKTAYVDRDWKVQPAEDDTFAIIADPGREHVNEGLAQAGGANTITLNANASSANDAYVGQIVLLKGGTGADQASHVIAYNGTTKVATINKNWAVQPDNTTTYVMLPTGMLYLAGLVSDIWGAATRSLTDKADFTLTSDYDDAKTAAQAGDAMTLTSAYDDAKTAAQAGDAMTLTSAYDKAKDDVLTPLGVVDGIVDAIKAKTDLIPASPAAVGSAMNLVAAYDTILETTLTNTTNSITKLNQIKTKTDLIPDSPAAVGSAMTLTSAYDAAKTAASQTSVNTVDTVVDAIKSTVDTNLDMKISDIDTTVAISSTEAQSVSTGSMDMSVYYTLKQTISSTYDGALSGATKLWFSIKEIGETDANALVFMEKTAGLTVVDKTAYATAAHGTITVTGSAGAWEIAIMVDEAATTLLAAYDNQYYEASLKALVSGDAVHIWDGECRITKGVIRTYA